MFRLAAVSRAARQRAAFTTGAPRTLFQKIWDSHVVHKNADGTCLLYIDRHLVHEVTSPQAFESLRLTGRKVRRPNLTLSVADHNVPTSDRAKGIANEESRIQVETLEANVRDFGIPYFAMTDIRQGVVHIIGPEQGFTQPGMTIVCGDSHTATHGAFGALAFGIGTSEVEHVLATQTLWQKPAKNMRIAVDGSLGMGVTSKDVVLHIIGLIGTAGGTGHVIEYAGEVIRNLSMDARMTICNMSIEAGARAGMIAPDDITVNYLKGRPMAPKGELWDKAVNYWKSLPSDAGAKYDTEIKIKAESIAPQITWGTSPQDVIPVTGTIPDPAKEKDPVRQATIKRALEYMGLQPGQPIAGTPVDVVFIGSCTNGRLEDIRAVVEVAKGHKVASGVHAMVVPGSGIVKQQAEKEGLDKILKEAGFDWREPGCSMCLAMNADQLKPKQRSASTSNRNFEGRQGREGRTHLVSPAMAAAAAITGKLTDVRTIQKRGFCTSRRMYSTQPNPMAFTSLKGTAAPLEITNCDTDMIIPKQFLKTIKRTGLGKHLFDELRYTMEGAEKPEFVLNKAPYRQARILVAGDNFGCGSSREHAPWAIADFGIKCVISTSFADIFYSNCFKNGILPVTVTKEQLDKLMTDAKAVKDLAIDLDKQTITRPSGEVIPFTIDPYRKHCLYNGLDDVALTLQLEKEIAAFEQTRAKATPWL